MWSTQDTALQRLLAASELVTRMWVVRKVAELQSGLPPQQGGIVYHMLSAASWQAHKGAQQYAGDTLATEGFIHCTGDRKLLVEVANRFYTSIDGEFFILSIDEKLVKPLVKWEPADGHLFPHIYGPLNLDAVVMVEVFPRGEDGRFLSLET